MTLINLINDISKDLELLFKSTKLKSSTGEIKPFTLYKGSLPIPNSEESPEPMPYILVYLSNGEAGLQNNMAVVRIVIGVFDDSLDNQGYTDVLNAIETIRQHYQKKPILYNRYIAKIDDKHNFSWSIPDEDTHPYYFGGIQLCFELSHEDREDEYC